MPPGNCRHAYQTYVPEETIEAKPISAPSVHRKKHLEKKTHKKAEQQNDAASILSRPNKTDEVSRKPQSKQASEVANKSAGQKKDGSRPANGTGHGATLDDLMSASSRPDNASSATSEASSNVNKGSTDSQTTSASDTSKSRSNISSTSTGLTGSDTSSTSGTSSTISDTSRTKSTTSDSRGTTADESSSRRSKLSEQLSLRVAGALLCLLIIALYWALFGFFCLKGQQTKPWKIAKTAALVAGLIFTLGLAFFVASSLIPHIKQAG